MFKRIQPIRKASQFFFLVLLMIGIYMDVRMVIMLFLPATILAGNFFCSWACPYGTVQELSAKVGKMILGQQIKMPRSIQKYLQYSKYILALVIATGILGSFIDVINGYGSFLGLFMNGFSLTTSVIVMISFVIIGMVFERPFCNYFCIESVKYGVLSPLRYNSIKRDADKCVNCKKCDTACPMNIEVSKKEQVKNGNCINCMECISACPVDEILTYGKVGFKFWG